MVTVISMATTAMLSILGLLIILASCCMTMIRGPKITNGDKMSYLTNIGQRLGQIFMPQRSIINVSILQNSMFRFINF